MRSRDGTRVMIYQKCFRKDQCGKEGYGVDQVRAAGCHLPGRVDVDNAQDSDRFSPTTLIRTPRLARSMIYIPV